jgi:hypothetical protein
MFPLWKTALLLALSASAVLVLCFDRELFEQSDPLREQDVTSSATHRLNTKFS